MRVKSKSWSGDRRGANRLPEGCQLAKPMGAQSMMGAASSCANELEGELFR